VVQLRKEKENMRNIVLKENLLMDEGENCFPVVLLSNIILTKFINIFV
jgi:hypothetical protein